jgi:protein TonB
MPNGGSKGNRYTPLTFWSIVAIAVCLSSGSCGKSAQEEAGKKQTDSLQTHKVSEVTDSVHHKVPTPKSLGWPDYPSPRSIVWPDYPQEIRGAGIEGMVFVRALVDTDGIVKKTELVRSLHPVLDTSALEAVSLWEFIPATQRGTRPVKIYTSVGVRFRKDDLPLPEYPEIAVEGGVQGTVIVKLLIDQKGSVSKSQVVKPAHPALDRAVTNASIQWQFWPPRHGEEPYEMTVMVPVRFTLSGGVRGGPEETWRVRPEGRVELVWPKGYLASRRSPGAGR